MSIPVVPIERIYPDPRNIRASLQGIPELAASIKARGLLQPIVVRPRPGGGFTVVDGHRRLEAAILAGLSALPCLAVRTTGRGDGDVLMVMLAAAMHQRLTPTEQAEAFRRLERRGMTATEIAEATGYSLRTVRDRLLWLDLPAEARRMQERGDLTVEQTTDLARQVARTRTGATTAAAPRPAHFDAAHPLYGTVRELCGHRTVRRMVGGAGCGQCWEAAIRADERDQTNPTAKERP